MFCDIHTFSKLFDPAFALRFQVSGEIRCEGDAHIPLSLIHPRWHLAGPANAYTQVFAVREQLNAEGKSRLDKQLTL